MPSIHILILSSHVDKKAERGFFYTMILATKMLVRDLLSRAHVTYLRSEFNSKTVGEKTD